MMKRNDMWVLHKCPDCHFGRIPAGVFGPDNCPTCKGTGQVVTYGGVKP